jgi:PAS domain-containing protein
MAQQPIELILLRQWSTQVSVAVFILSADGHLVFYNDSAAQLLGRTYDEVGDLTLDMLSEAFRTADMSGQPLPWRSLPLSTALERRRPEYLCFRYEALDGVMRDVEVVAFPIESAAGAILGVAALFWEADIS